MGLASKLSRKILSFKAVVGIVGVGYVGESLALATSNAGFKTNGFEIDKTKIEKINKLKHKNLKATDDKKLLASCDIICICVPTPTYKDNTPNLEYLTIAAKEIGKYLQNGQLIVLESSVAPGTTRNIVAPILREAANERKADFFVAFSPERIDPGNTKYGISITPKVVSGLDEESKQLTIEFYSKFVKQIVPVSTLEIAEMTKVFENVFRLVNISLVNELSDFARSLGINMWEVIDAAATKPYGFLAHYPGPGAGGECIPVLPYYLLDSAKKLKVDLPIVKKASETNHMQPHKVASHALRVLNGSNSKNGQRKALIVGVAYKGEVNDIRGSAALAIWEKLEKEGVSVYYHDPYVEHINGFSSKQLHPEFLSEVDVIIIATAHKNISYDLLVNCQKPLIDTRNVLREFASPHIHRI